METRMKYHPDHTHTPAAITPRASSVHPAALRLRPMRDDDGRGFFTGG
jgi:hypothetical protein